MQTWITDYNFRISASNLDVKRLNAQISEGIQILASLTGLNDKLINPKEDVSNWAQAKLWKGYEQDLMNYLAEHMNEWYSRDYSSEINVSNLDMIMGFTAIYPMFNQIIPKWICPELIITHRSVLIQKEPEFYGSKWPNVPKNKTMRYDWRIYEKH